MQPVSPHCDRPEYRLILVAVVAWVMTTASSAQQRPNVLFIAVDDLRPTLGCYGDPVAISPNIDQLAAAGTVFRRAYCQLAVCCPSRLSVLTGLRPDTIKVWDLKTHFRSAIPDAVSLPQYFKKRGYHTQSIGKVFHGSGAPSKDPPSWSVTPLYDTNRETDLRYATARNRKGEGLKRSATESADVPDETYLDGRVGRDAVNAIGQLAQSDQPFFLAVGFRKPHLPFCAPARYWQQYQRDQIPLPKQLEHPEGAPELAVRSWRELEGYTDINNDGSISLDQLKRLRHGYYACVSYTDALVGKLLEALRRFNLTSNTMIVLWGDHGFHLGEQGLWTKSNNYELSTRVPLIISAPWVSGAAQSTRAMVELVDLYPTLCEGCRLPVPEGLEGTSLLPLLKDPQRPWKTAAFSQFPRALQGHRHKAHGDIMGYAIRSDRYRFVQWRSWNSQQPIAIELYDHQRDPLESKNVANDPAYQSALDNMRAMLESGWREARPPES